MHVSIRVPARTCTHVQNPETCTPNPKPDYPPIFPTVTFFLIFMFFLLDIIFIVLWYYILYFYVTFQ